MVRKQLSNTSNGTLPNGWRKVTFGDVVRDVKESERAPDKAGLTRFLGLEHLEPENLRITDWGVLADEDVSFTKRFRKGQVLFGKRRAYQRKVAIADFDGVCSSDILTLEPKDHSLHQELLPFIVRSDSFFDFALGTSSGSLSPRTRWNQLKDYRFVLPPMDYQCKVAAIVSAAYSTVQLYDEAIESCSQLITSVRTEMIAHGRGSQTMKSTEIGDIPSHWNVESIGELCKSKIRDFGSFSSTKLITFLDQGVAFLKSEMIEDGELNSNDVTFISEDVHEQLTKSWVYPGNLLYSKIGSALGKAVIYDGRFGVCNSNAAIAKIDVDSEKMLPEYLCHVLNAPQIKRRMERNIISLLPRINLGDINKFVVAIPPIQEQQVIVEILDEANRTIFAANVARESCVAVIKNVMSDMLAGEATIHV